MATKAPMKDVPVMVIRLTFLGIFELFNLGPPVGSRKRTGATST